MKWSNENSKAFLKASYLQEGQTTDERVREIADAAEKLLGIPGYADKFYNYMDEGYFSLSSPVWSNFGTNRGLPVSCFGSSIEDNIGDIIFTQGEVGVMSKVGGGTSGYFGNLRPRGAAITNNGVSSGAVHFMQMFENITDVISQGSVRRGKFSPYLPIEHPDANEFLEIGSEGNPIQDLTYGVTVTKKWLEEMKAGDISKRELWAKVIKMRGEIGYPYIMYLDNANKSTKHNTIYKDNNRKIIASNLCSEIMLPSDDKESFVCVLSSINLAKYDELKETDAVETLTYFLDAVVTEFITKIEAYGDSDKLEYQHLYYYLRKALAFAKNHRALGLGVLGYHTYLQQNLIPWESKDAAKFNLEVFKYLDAKTRKASRELFDRYGGTELTTPYKVRNATLMAIAPTTSSAFILGQVSQGIEPIWSNCYVKDVAKLKVTIKNPNLEKLLESKGCNTREIWKSIRDYNGSVQHLKELTDNEKDVFKTFPEISQQDILYQAGVRQQYIDQGQSLNLMIHPDTPIKEINRLLLLAEELGLKSLYYQHSMNAAQALNLKHMCAACEA